MEIHELNIFSGTPGASDYLATDNGTDTSKISIATITGPLNARIDNIIAGGDAPSEAEVTDARLGAAVLGSVQYASLGNAIRGQATDLYKFIGDISERTKNLWFNGDIDVPSSDGGVVSGDGYVQFLLKNPLPAGTYTISCKCTSSFTGSTDSIIRFSSSQSASSMSGFVGDASLAHSGTRTSVTVTLTGTAYSVRALAGTTVSNSEGKTAAYSDIQIETGETATAYIEPLIAYDKYAVRALNLFITSGNIGTTYSDADDLPANSIVQVHSTAGMAHYPSITTGQIITLSHTFSGAMTQLTIPLNPTYDSNVYLRTKLDAGWTSWRVINGEYDIYPTGDDTDRALDIIAVLNTKGTCRLAKGDYYFDVLVMPPGTEIIGCGEATRLIRKSDSGHNYFLRAQKNCKIKNVTLLGDTSDITVSPHWERSATVTDMTAIIGIRISGQGASDTNGMRAEVGGVTIERFAGSAIQIDNTGYSPLGGCHVHDVFVRNCNCGIALGRYAEFHRVTGCSYHECYYGAVNNGGNNVFENCDFSTNKQGLLMDNSSGNYGNSSHGSFIGCTFNHSDENNGTAIELDTMVAGEMFVGCQIFYGAIVLTASQGIVFDACNIGAFTPITITDGGGVQFANCTFRPGASPVTDNRSTKTHFDNCYYLSGTAVNGTPQ